MWVIFKTLLTKETLNNSTVYEEPASPCDAGEGGINGLTPQTLPQKFPLLISAFRDFHSKIEEKYAGFQGYNPPFSFIRIGWDIRRFSWLLSSNKLAGSHWRSWVHSRSGP
jgi:hypothetical protein